MGSSLCTLFKQKPVKLLFYGLYATGKTTLLYKLKLGEIGTVCSTLGFNLEDLDINGIRSTVWDVGLRCKTRPFIRHFLDTTDAVLFFIDSSNSRTLDQAVDEFFVQLYATVQERQLPVVVLANKQDKGAVVSPKQIKAAFYDKGGEDFRVNTALEVFPTVALTLEGVTPALDWLTSQLTLRMARDAYFLSWWSKVKHFPASFVKSACNRVVGPGHSSVGEDKKTVNAETVAGK